MIEEIVGRHERPIIGVIGATTPLPGYDGEDAFRLGYDLRRFVEQKGCLFTGGVSGVGVDFYQGVAQYCSEKNVPDKFFVLLPEDMDPPEDYVKLAGKTQNRALAVERAGKDLEERRTYLGALADLLVVVNGSTGTIDEAVKGLMLGKRVICLEESGGAADVLCRLKRGEIKDASLDIEKNLLLPFGSVYAIGKYLSSERTEGRI